MDPIFDDLTGTSVFASNSPDPGPQLNRAQRRALMAERRKMTRRFERQIKQLTRGSIYGDEA